MPIFDSADLDRFATDLFERLRPHFTEVAAVAYQQAIADAPRATFGVGTVTGIRADLLPPEVEVAVDGELGKTYAQCMVNVPLVGQRVGLIFIPPSGALAWPIANAAPYRDVTPRLSMGNAVDVPLGAVVARLRLIDSHTVHYYGQVITTGGTLGPDRVFLSLPIGARYAPVGNDVSGSAGHMTLGPFDTQAQVANRDQVSSFENTYSLGGNLIVSWNLTYEVAGDYDYSG